MKITLMKILVNIYEYKGFIDFKLIDIAITLECN